MDDSHDAKVASDHDEGTKSNGLTVTDELKQHIISTAKWAKFFAVLGFIMIGFYLCSLLLLMLLGGKSMDVIFYFVFFIFIYFFPVSYLWKFATKTIEGIEDEDQERFEEGFSQLFSHFRYVGILTIIGLSLIVLSFFLGFLGKGY
ncbi:MAG: hypothetical protein RL110_1668 [Bacteroidota bacterium]|jgi:hypothetical protein